MSRATKRKHVFNEVLQEDFAPPQANQQIVKVISSRGNNLHEVETADSDTFLISMPSKFRKNIWIKRGDFILVEPIEEGDKVKGEMVKPITAQFIKYLKAEKLWPSQFSDDDSVECGDDALFVNPNRITLEESTSEEEEEEESD